MHRGTLNPRIANTSSPHIYADVQEISSQQVVPETKTRWKGQDLQHPLGQSTGQKSDSNFVEQMDIEPIRNPLIAHQKYLSHSNHNPHPYNSSKAGEHIRKKSIIVQHRTRCMPAKSRIIPNQMVWKYHFSPFSSNTPLIQNDGHFSL